MKKLTLKTVFPLLTLILIAHSHAEELSFEKELKQGCAKIP